MKHFSSDKAKKRPATTCKPINFRKSMNFAKKYDKIRLNDSIIIIISCFLASVKEEFGDSQKIPFEVYMILLILYKEENYGKIKHLSPS